MRTPQNALAEPLGVRDAIGKAAHEPDDLLPLAPRTMHGRDGMISIIKAIIVQIVGEVEEERGGGCAAGQEKNRSDVPLTSNFRHPWLQKIIDDDVRVEGLEHVGEFRPRSVERGLQVGSWEGGSSGEEGRAISTSWIEGWFGSVMRLRFTGVEQKCMRKFLWESFFASSKNGEIWPWANHGSIRILRPCCSARHP